ncbi:MAG: response regulator [Desulfobacteraceae bacterium]
MNSVVFLDAVAVLASLTAGVFLLAGWKRSSNLTKKLPLTGLILFTLLYNLFLLLEWSHIIPPMEAFEDFIGALLPLWWLFVFYAFLKELSTQDLLRSEEKYRDIVESTDNFVGEASPDGKFIFVNETGLRMLGLTPEECLGRSVIDFIHPDDRERTIEHLSQWIQDRIPSAVLENRMVSQSGQIQDMFWTIHFHFDDHGDLTSIKSIAHDITDLKNARKENKKLHLQLQQAQKMEAIGTLSGGIAHDFNNILTPILVGSETALMDISGQNPARESIERVLQAGYRAKDLVKQILTFSRQNKDDLTVLQMEPIVKEVIKFLRSILPTTIEIETVIQAPDSTILAEPTQVHQVVMNLCTNAAHAMKETGGTLSVRLESAVLDAAAMGNPMDLPPGNYARLCFSDTGHGMDPHTMEKIFDPFFTTKAKSEGTGLGLSLVHGIVKGLGGAITVESEEAKGSSFEVYLPEVAKPHVEQVEISEPLPEGNERILLVDDEQAMRDIIGQMLTRLGYEVVAKGNGVEALEALREQPASFDLVITDQTMPRMTGRELCEEILTTWPDVPVILCTGFSEWIDEDTAKRIGVREFIMKPIIMHDLAQKIRKTLSSQAEIVGENG